MCIIVVKPKNVDMPSEEIIKNCFNHNKDGAGFMYFNSEGKINIEKGFMTLTALETRLAEKAFKKEDLVVFHFRIGTSGGNIAGNTHPFPISNEVEQLKATTLEGLDIAIVHNGVIPITREIEDNSDTQEFIRTRLSHPDVRSGLRFHKKSAHKIINKNTGTSRFCILTEDGKFVCLGNGWSTENGIMYSNSSYKTRTYSTPTYNYNARKWNSYWGCWEDELTDTERKCCDFSRRGSHSASAPDRPKDYFRPANEGEKESRETREDIIKYELGENDKRLREVLENFLDVFFLSWHGQDTKFNLKHAFEVGFETVKDNLIALEKEEKEALLV